MAEKWKLTDPLGFAALIESIKKALKTSDAAASGVSGLQGDIQGLAEQTAKTLQQASDALQKMDNEKLSKTNAVPFSIPMDGWQEDFEAGDEAGDKIGEYPAYYELAAEGVTANDRATIIIAPASVAAAVACGICPTCETLTGKIKIRAARMPTEDIDGEYWIETGKE